MVSVFGASVYPLVLRFVEPLMIGFAPLPYAPNVMGDPLVPEDGTVSAVPYQMSPRLNRIESPGENVELFTFAIGLPGRAGASPAVRVAPAAATK